MDKPADPSKKVVPVKQVPLSRRIKKFITATKDKITEVMVYMPYAFESLFTVLSLYAALALSFFLMKQKYNIFFNEHFIPSGDLQTHFSSFELSIAMISLLIIFKICHIYIMYDMIEGLKTALMTAKEPEVVPEAAKPEPEEGNEEAQGEQKPQEDQPEANQEAPAEPVVVKEPEAPSQFMVYFQGLLFLAGSFVFLDIPYYIMSDLDHEDKKIFRNGLVAIQSLNSILIQAPCMMFTVGYLICSPDALQWLSLTRQELDIVLIILLVYCSVGFMIGTYKFQYFVCASTLFVEQIPWSLLRLFEFLPHCFLVAYFINICLLQSNMIPIYIYIGSLFILSAGQFVVHRTQELNDWLLGNSEQTKYPFLIPIRAIINTFFGKIFYLHFSEVPYLFPSLYNQDNSGDPVPDPWYRYFQMMVYYENHTFTFSIWSFRIIEQVNLLLFILCQTDIMNQQDNTNKSILYASGLPLSMILTCLTSMYYIRSGYEKSFQNISYKYTRTC